MQMKFIWFSVLVIFLTFTGCNDKKENTPKEEAPKEQTIQEKTNPEPPSDKKIVVLSDTNGTQWKIEQIDDRLVFEGLEDKVVLLNFFATWCPPCKAEIPHLINLQNKYKDKFTIISVLLEENKPNEQIQEFIKEYEINYTVTNSAQNFVLADLVGGVKSIPLMLLYDTKGKQVQNYTGAIPEEMLEIDIQAAF